MRFLLFLTLFSECSVFQTTITWWKVLVRFPFFIKNIILEILSNSIRYIYIYACIYHFIPFFYHEKLYMNERVWIFWWEVCAISVHSLASPCVPKEKRMVVFAGLKAISTPFPYTNSIIHVFIHDPESKNRTNFTKSKFKSS